MADEDNFDIDIYGDDATQDYSQDNTGDSMKVDEGSGANNSSYSSHGKDEVKMESVQDDAMHGAPSNEQQQIASTGGSAHNQIQLPKQAPVQQGTKRKEGADDRPIDPGATSALLISELHWWQNEDDIRGWANQAGCEDELNDVTFNEHKVNGKSKGQCFVEMASEQAATALKHKIQSFGEGVNSSIKKPAVVFHNPSINPYRTLPKDVPGRKDGNRQDNRSISGNFGGSSGGMNNMQGNMQSNFNSNFRGRSFGNNSSRGGMNNSMGNFQNRNFSNPMNNMPANNYGGNMGFGNNPMGGMNQFGNFNRGNMMGGMRNMPNRGGRGGMAPNMMGMGGMGNMGMGSMGGMPMGNMGGNMGNNMGGNMGNNMGGNMGGNMGMGMGGFGAQPHFNPAFFGQTQQSVGGGGGGTGDWSNPHGAKRPRPE